MALNSALSWYQRKIGTYDKQLWEKTVEQRILKIGVFNKQNLQRTVEQPCKGLGNVPKKTTRLKTELIDVDLVQGSAFPKAKPQHGTIVAARKGLTRVIFLPFYLGWWRQQTSVEISLLLLIIYVCQVVTSLYLLYIPQQKECSPDLVLIEVLLPGILMTLLGMIHSQVVATVITGRRTCRTRTKKKRLKRRPSSAKATSRCSSMEKNTTEAKPTSHPTVPKQSASESTLIAKNDLEEKPNNDPTEELSHETDDSDSLTSESSPRAPRPPLDDRSDGDARNDSAVQDISSGDVETDPLPSDVEGEIQRRVVSSPTASHSFNHESRRTPLRRRIPQSLSFAQNTRLDSTCNSSCESELDTTSPNTPVKEHLLDADWGMTTNTEGENSYSSNSETEDEGRLVEDPFGKLQGTGNTTPTTTCPTSDKVSCTIWERSEVHKVDLSVLDISALIIQRVDNTSVGTDYLMAGLGFAIIVSLLPGLIRLYFTLSAHLEEGIYAISLSDILDISISAVLRTTMTTQFVLIAAMFNSFCLSMLFFFLLAVAERTFKQRFLYAKLFCHLTSSRRARKSDLPHFRLNKVRNIKTWLSVRSYLKRHGPQRSVDVIVSAAFLLAFIIICFLCFQLMKDSENFGQSLLHWELMVWTLALGIYLLRFMTLGAKINKKYRNPSVLITEQINLYLQMEQKPHKKEGLTLANNVLKLAADLLKELESPFKISGLSANPYLYNITKLVILSAFSAVMKELLGFKLKLYKIKIK